MNVVLILYISIFEDFAMKCLIMDVSIIFFIVNNYSRYTWVYVFKNKSKAGHAL